MPQHEGGVICGKRIQKLHDRFERGYIEESRFYYRKQTAARAKVEENKAQYLERYGELNWQWVDEGLPNTIMDYHGSIGSVLDFTEDDWRACKENGWTLDEVLTLCDEEEFSPNGDSLEQFFSNFPDDMPKEDAIAAVEDFYTWFWKKLSKVKEILGNG